MLFLRKAWALAAPVLYLFLLWAAATRLPGIPSSTLNPTMAMHLWNAVTKAEKKGQPENALKSLEPLLQAFPDNPQYLSSSAENLGKLGRFAESAATWEKFVRVAPFPADACPHLGNAYESAGHQDKALDAHRRCLAMDPSKSDLMLFLGLALERRGQIEEAAKLYRTVLHQSPTYSDARIGMARIKLRQGNIQEADALAQQVLITSPRNSDALFVSALIAEKRDRPQEAIALLQKAIDIAPAYQELRVALKRLGGNK